MNVLQLEYPVLQAYNAAFFELKSIPCMKPNFKKKMLWKKPSIAKKKKKDTQLGVHLHM